MDFGNERYVRLYVRETTTWKLLGWEAQALLPRLLCMVDRAGVLDLAGVEPWEAVAAHLPKWPDDVVKAGLQDLLRRGVVELGDDQLVWPRYIEGQEAASSDAQRARESRAKRRDLARHGVTERDDESHNEAKRHDESQRVTLRSTTPYNATPNLELSDSDGVGLSAGSDAAGSSSGGDAPDPHPGRDASGHQRGDAPQEITHVLSAMRDAMRELNPRSPGPRDTPENRKAIRRPMRNCAASVDDWRLVIRRQLESVRRDRSKWKYLSLSTLGRPKNFQRMLDLDDEAVGDAKDVRVGHYQTTGTEDYGDGEIKI